MTGITMATIRYRYDELNRLTHVEHGDGFQLEYRYDGAGNMTEVVVGQARDPEDEVRRAPGGTVLLDDSE
jgi:YD repeat-containing protein